MVGITTAGDCSPEGTIDADHSGHDVHFRSFTGSAKVRMSCNVEVIRTVNRIVSYDSTICHRNFKGTINFERRQTRITNCDFRMPNFSETRTPDAGIEPTSLT